MKPADFIQSCVAVIEKADQARLIGSKIRKNKRNKKRWKDYDQTVHEIFVNLTPLSRWMSDYVEKNKNPEARVLSQWETSAE